MSSCDFCASETDELTTFPSKGFVYTYERLFVASPPAYWKACRVCTNYIRKEEKEAFLGHCAVWQCVFDGLELNDSNVKAVKSVIKPLHKAFFESLGAPMSN